MQMRKGGFRFLSFLFVCRLLKIPSGNLGLYDPMEIHNRGQLKSHMKDVLVKMGFYLVAFFVYLYW